ncbi:hypothetical protein AB0M50_38720 [Nonomuraea fuscirosea]|uniref:hypothetical protein n=1 Tax=Nonomuraea fuscirosea TaxID=1291556 RepID=UPI0034361C0E
MPGVREPTSAGPDPYLAQPPGFDDDGIVIVDTAWLVRWYSGTVSLAAAQRAGGNTVAAPPWLIREPAGWGRLSPFADVLPARRASATAGG